MRGPARIFPRIACAGLISPDEEVPSSVLEHLKAGEKEVDWRAELAAKLIFLQWAEGPWANENGRWM